MRSPLLLTGVLASLTAGTTGCGLGINEQPDAEAATSSSAAAVVVIERTTGPGDAVRDDSVSARFVRVNQGTVDDQALRIAGAAWDLPAVGTCASSQEAQPALQPRSVELIDVGNLTLEAPRTRTTALAPRTMPDIGMVSGVVYAARSPEAFTAAEQLQLHAGGTPNLPEGFLVSATAPRDVADLRVVSTASGLDVAWEAPESNDARDTVYIDVLGAAGNARRLVARCTTLDVGHYVIPDRALGAAVLDDGQVAVHRLHRERFNTKGIDSGEIRFDVARVVTFRR